MIKARVLGSLRKESEGGLEAVIFVYHDDVIARKERSNMENSRIWSFGIVVRSRIATFRSQYEGDCDLQISV